MKKLFLILMMMVSNVIWAEPLKVRLWVGFPPGGSSDTVAREVQRQIMAQDPNSTVVVEYASGMGGVLALKKLVTMPRTQYVELLIDGSNQLLTAYLAGTNDVDLDNSVKVVTPIGYTQMVLIASQKSKIYDLDSLKKAVKQRKLNFASAGYGSTTFSTTAYIAYREGIIDSLIHIPYKGVAPFYIDLISGEVDIASDYLVSGIAHINSGAVVPLAVTGNKRNPMIPEVKTLREQGIDKFPLNPWFAVFTNNTSDPEKVAQVKSVLTKSMSSADTISRLTAIGLSVVSSEEIEHPEVWYSKQQQEFKSASNKLIAIFPATRE